MRAPGNQEEQSESIDKPWKNKCSTNKTKTWKSKTIKAFKIFLIDYYYCNHKNTDISCKLSQEFDGVAPDSGFDALINLLAQLFNRSDL